MSYYNDGKAFVYQNTGESVMVVNKSCKISGSIEDQELITALGLTASSQSQSSVSGEVVPLCINNINNKAVYPASSYSGNVNNEFFLDTVVVSANVIDEGYISASKILAAQTVVAGTTFDTKFVTWHMKPIILKKRNLSSSNQSATTIKMNNSYKVAGEHTKATIKVPFNYCLNGLVYASENKILIKNGSALVDDASAVIITSGVGTLEPIVASVEDYKPPVWGNTGSGSGVKTMIIIIQKNVFSEIYMSFDDTKITEVIGLPQGMFLDGQYLKGSPKTSGSYNVKMKLDNLRTLEITLQVPEILREL